MDLTSEASQEKRGWGKGLKGYKEEVVNSIRNIQIAFNNALVLVQRFQNSLKRLCKVPIPCRYVS